LSATITRRGFEAGTYLFIVDDEGYCDLCVVPPLQPAQTCLAVPAEVSVVTIVRVGRVSFRHDDDRFQMVERI